MSGASEETRRLGAGLAFCSPWIIGFCAFTALPVGLSLYYSFFDYTLLREPVEYRCWDLTSVTPQVGVAHVVRENDQDVRTSRVGSVRERRYRKYKGETE